MNQPATTYHLAITPLDTLFFRNGTPFGMGDETWTESALMPNPSVIWGALFTAMLSQGLVSTKDTGDLKITDLYLRKKGDRGNAKNYLPAPLDIFYKSHQNAGAFKDIYLSDEYPIDGSGIIASLPAQVNSLLLPAKSNHKLEKAEQCWIESVALTGQYSRGLGNFVLYGNHHLSAMVPKVGIGRSDDTHSAQEGQLYRIDMSEFKENWQIGVHFQAPPRFQVNGVLRLGGEGKTAEYRSMDPVDSKEDDTGDDGRYKIYFQTPAFFKSGDGIAEVAGIKNVRLLSAALNKPVWIGGFDLKIQQPKTMRKAVPAGSVYLVEGRKNEIADAIRGILEQEDQTKGFGIFKLL